MTPKFFLAITGMCLLPVLGLSQPGVPDWEFRFGGGAQDELRQIIEASNGYLLAVGETQSGSSGKSDGLLLILDHSTGRKLVEKRIGGSKADGLSGIVQTYDGYFLLAGYTESAGQGKKDGWLVKIDETGTIVWEKTFGGPGDDHFSHIALLPDASLAVAGQRDGGSKGDIWLAQITEQTLISDLVLGKNKYAAVKGMAVTADGGIVIAGNTGAGIGNGKGDAFLLKTDVQGKVAWERTFGDKEWEEATHLIVTPDDGFALAGMTNSSGAGGMDMWLVKPTMPAFSNGRKPTAAKTTTWLSRQAPIPTADSSSRVVPNPIIPAPVPSRGISLKPNQAANGNGNGIPEAKKATPSTTWLSCTTAG